MKTTLLSKAKNQAKVKVEITKDILDQHFDVVFERLAHNVEVKGFRPGKAPRRMIVEQLGANRISEDVLNLAVQESVPQALEKHELRVATQPRLNIIKWVFNPLTDEEHILEYDLELDLIPNVKLGDYTKIKVKPDKKLQDYSVKEDEIEKVIKKLRLQSAKLLPLERTAQKGDWAEISFSGSVNGISRESLQSIAHPIILGEGNLIAGFEENILGLRTGEKKAFELKLPINFRDKESAGKVAKFEATLKNLKKIELPELNNQFAQKFAKKNIKDLESAIKKSIEDEKHQRAREAIQSQVIEKALRLLTVSIPDGLVHQEAHQRLHQIKQNITRQGMDFEKYLQAINKTKEGLEKELLPQALQSIKIGLLLGEIAQRENIKPGKDQIKLALNRLVAIASE